MIENLEMYCRKCGKMMKAVNIEKKDSKRGKYAQGKCISCGRTIIRKLKKEDW